MHPPEPKPVPPPPGSTPAATGEYEYRRLTIPRDYPRAEARRLLTEHAEYGRWELALVRVHMGGTRQVWLRRRIIRATRTV